MAVIRADRPLVDPDQIATWPKQVTDLVQGLDEIVTPTNSATDLDVPEEADEAIRRALADVRVKAFHATRLLPHEADEIRRDGLRVFSRDLFDGRIDRARAAGHLTAQQRQELRNAHMYAIGEERARGMREGQVCLTLRQAAFGHGAHALLSHWGGEGLYFSSGARVYEPLLQELEKPSIVVVALNVRPRCDEQPMHPTIGRTFLGAWRGLQDGADVFHQVPIPGTDVLDIWQPGHGEYEAIATLPRT